MKLGEAMLAGEIEYRKGNLETAFELLREAVRYVRHNVASGVFEALSLRISCYQGLPAQP